MRAGMLYSFVLPFRICLSSVRVLAEGLSLSAKTSDRQILAFINTVPREVICFVRWVHPEPEVSGLNTVRFDSARSQFRNRERQVKVSAIGQILHIEPMAAAGMALAR